MCPLNPSYRVVPPYVGETAATESDDSDEADTIYCQIAIGHIHVDTDAALCITCYFRLPNDEKSNWVIAAKHLLIIGEPSGIICSRCNLNRITSTRDPLLHCYKCQIAHLKYLDGRETPYIDSDGNIVITIFHMLDCDFRLYREYIG